MPISRRDFVKTASAAAALSAIGSRADALSAGPIIHVPEHAPGIADYRELAMKALDAAKAAGADFVKFQCYSPDELVDLRGDGPAPEPWGSQGWTMRALYEKARTPFEWFPTLFAHARAIGIVPFASVFGAADLGAVIKQATAQLGTPLADIELTGNLAFLLPAGVNPPSWKVPTASAPQSAAEACYRKALLDVRTALKSDNVDAADAALAGSETCVAADPAIAARERNLREFVLTLRGT